MTSPSDISAAITPGSLPYGERQQVTAGIQQALGGGQSAGQPQGITPPPPVDSTQDPLAALLSGSLDPGGGGSPLTSGLSVGPGAGPSGQERAPDPVRARLQQIATQADSPMLRSLGRMELRLLSNEPV